jgi:hypothetical protein
MVKPPQTRHSKKHKDPVTIELEPGAVSRVPENTDSYEEATNVDIGAASPEEAEHIADAAQSDDSSAHQQSSGSEPETEGDRLSEYSDDASKPAAEETGLRFGRAQPQEAADPANLTRAPAEPVRKSGLGGLAAGLLGGLVALAAAAGLQYSGLMPSLGSAGGSASIDVSGIQTELAALRDQVASVQSGGAGDVDNRLQTLTDSAGRVDGLAATLDQIKTDVEGLKSAVESGGAGESAGLTALDAKIAELAKTVAALGQGGAGTGGGDSAAINEKLTGIETAVTAASSAASANDGRIAAIEKSVSAVEQNVAALTGKVEAQSSQPKVALAIAVSSLKAAVDAGRPFSSEVETFAAVAPNAPELSELRAVATKGVASPAEIAAEAPEAAGAMIDAARTVDQNAGIFERLLSSAETLVKVRPVGPVEGSGVPETVARLEAALIDGDFARALAEYETLPEASKAAGRSLVDKVRARLAAEQLVEKATAAALKSA